ncbi:MAG: DUF3419 family protein, partial [Chlamydiales bacterium]
MGKFFSRLSYSLGNEDWETEAEALKIQSHDTVLCITASGDRPLNLLMNDCRKIVSIDANPVQNYLLNLKIGAMQTFSYERYLSFLGAVSEKGRKEGLQLLLPLLDKDSAEFWLKNQKMIDKGVLYQGAMERLLKPFAGAMGIMRRKTLKKLFSFQDLDEQRKFVQQHWDRKWWRKAFEWLLSPSITPFYFEDPGLVNIGSKINPGVYIYERIMHSLNHCLANQNPLFSLIFQGYLLPAAYSPYLTQSGTKIIKQRIDRITIRTGEVVQYLESLTEPTFDCFSLSDIASYMDASHFIRLLRVIHKVAKPGARFCIRQFLSSQQMPLEMQGFFERDLPLEQRLEKEDRCFLYRFLVGTIK